LGSVLVPRSVGLVLVGALIGLRVCLGRGGCSFCEGPAELLGLTGFGERRVEIPPLPEVCILRVICGHSVAAG
jgi:hypothetical protein